MNKLAGLRCCLQFKGGARRQCCSMRDRGRKEDMEAAICTARDDVAGGKGSRPVSATFAALNLTPVPCIVLSCLMVWVELRWNIITRYYQYGETGR